MKESGVALLHQVCLSETLRAIEVLYNSVTYLENQSDLDDTGSFGPDREHLFSARKALDAAAELISNEEADGVR